MSNLRWIGRLEDEVRLYRFKQLCLPSETDLSSRNLMKISIADVETNGLDYKIHKIIELGILNVIVDRDTGELLKVLAEYNHLQDPGQPLDKKIIQVTGIVDSDLIGHNIDWDLVNLLFEDVELILSFNAKFDRAFIDVMSVVSSQKDWACAFEQIPWLDQGFPEKSQKNLCFYHGFFYDAHRAINDVYALTHLLSHSSVDNKFYFKTLLEEKDKIVYLVVARKTSFEKKSYFNLKTYQWQNDLKMWYKYYETEDSALTELEEIKEVYQDSAFNAEKIEITSKNRFKPIEILASSQSSTSVALKKNDLGKFTKPLVIVAENTHYATRTVLKKRGYDWFENKNNKNQKFWYLFVTEEEAQVEKDWLKENVYDENIFSGRILKNRYYKPPVLN